MTNFNKDPEGWSLLPKAAFWLTLTLIACSGIWIVGNRLILQPLQQGQHQENADFIESKRTSLLQTMNSLKTVDSKIATATETYQSYVATLPKDQTQWTDEQKLENNRLAITVNGLNTEKARQIAQMKADAAIAPKAITPEVATFLKTLP